MFTRDAAQETQTEYVETLGFIVHKLKKNWYLGFKRLYRGIMRKQRILHETISTLLAII